MSLPRHVRGSGSILYALLYLCGERPGLDFYLGGRINPAILEYWIAGLIRIVKHLFVSVRLLFNPELSPTDC